jgi:hypothetical protein
MKGIVFNLFEEFVAREHGEAAFDEIVEATELKTAEPFVGPGTYPDEDLVALVGTAVQKFDLVPADALRAFGRYCLPRLADKVPQFLASHADCKSFLKSVQGVVHVEVLKLFRGAYVPHFEYEDPAPNRLVMKYRSKRRLCHFAQGLIEGAASHFKNPVDLVHLCASDVGGDTCTFDVTFH